MRNLLTTKRSLLAATPWPLVWLVLSALASPVSYAVETLDLGTSQDTTLYLSETGEFANGGGQHLFVGSNGTSAERRGLIEFDLSGIPGNAVVQEVVLSLTMSRASSGIPVNIGLHRVTSPWAEGLANALGGEGAGAAAAPGDATWIHTGLLEDDDDEIITEWLTPGGDFISVPSDSSVIGSTGRYSWGRGEESTLVEDVQQWLDSPGENYGWALVGVDTFAGSAKRFDTRSIADELARPRLRISYDFGDCSLVSPAGDANRDGNVQFDDFLILSQEFGTGPRGGLLADFDCSGSVEFADFLILSENFGTTSPAQNVPEPLPVTMAWPCVILLIMLRRRSDAN